MWQMLNGIDSGFSYFSLPSVVSFVWVGNDFGGIRTANAVPLDRCFSPFSDLLSVSEVLSVFPRMRGSVAEDVRRRNSEIPSLTPCLLVAASSHWKHLAWAYFGCLQSLPFQGGSPTRACLLLFTLQRLSVTIFCIMCSLHSYVWWGEERGKSPVKALGPSFWTKNVKVKDPNL